MSKENFDVAVSDFYEVSGKVAEQYSKFWEKMVAMPSSEEDPSATVMADFAEAMREVGSAMMEHPEKVIADQLDLMKQQQELYQNTVLKFLGQAAEPVAAPDPRDRRFQNSEWSENPVFDYIKQLYLLQGNALMKMIEDTEGLSDKTKSKVEFFARQYVNALSPTNFAGLNPEVIAKTLETKGDNLAIGMKQLMEDMDDSVKGALNVTMTDTSAFQVGRNVAVTPGKVVYQNDLIQLLQFNPTTDEVHERPLLVVPPFINKYYVLDLREDNSLIKWLVDEGHTVFCISWVNAGPELRDKSFSDYVTEGVLEAVKAVEDETGVKGVNAIGYCVGGTLLATTMAYLKKKRRAPIKTATFYTTLLDFSEPGEIGMFINETTISALEKQMDMLGYFDGRQMSFSFNVLKENDLFWSFFVNNYLKGERPAAFDLLYWNTDSTNLPAATQSYYLRNMYLCNKLIEPNGIEIDGVKIDLSKIDQPKYFVSASQDHIALWKATYKGATVVKGDTRFVLGGSGHIAGIVNPPHKKKYGYSTNEALPATPEEWYEGSTQHEGSWWLDWKEWIVKQNGEKMVPAREPGSGKLEIIEDAPGTYVCKRIADVVK
jgi:polyhydroxyalkanoate synthase